MSVGTVNWTYWSVCRKRGGTWEERQLETGESSELLPRTIERWHTLRWEGKTKATETYELKNNCVCGGVAVVHGIHTDIRRRQWQSCRIDDELTMTSWLVRPPPDVASVTVNNVDLWSGHRPSVVYGKRRGYRELLTRTQCWWWCRSWVTWTLAAMSDDCSQIRAIQATPHQSTVVIRLPLRPV